MTTLPYRGGHTSTIRVLGLGLHEDGVGSALRVESLVTASTSILEGES